MKFALKIKDTPYNFMRQCGYHPAKKEGGAGELAFIRRAGSGDYPRFHVYLKVDDVSRETIIINLHLDQKKPIYKGAPAHAGEYEGEIIIKEAERIKSQAQNLEIKFTR